eukprot:CAMPEP_0181349970 /NCGR_PEP_ID=MMETSP1106-20121128/1012_1 /TAXON_ID=81844 /ORGANISM="Mantoniella antarctica, Strain SL-175" /LENGTH=69 /DNA_ID=CAMNT_0023462403 /DNA_START=34 /DNA_END=243 /DNA_ORIENTATION=-
MTTKWSGISSATVGTWRTHDVAHPLLARVCLLAADRTHRFSDDRRRLARLTRLRQGRKAREASLDGCGA